MANESLFKISCPSCEAVFAVVDPELVGQIVACPKCGGMILVEPSQTASQTASETVPTDAAKEAPAPNAANCVDERGAENASELVDEALENDRSENAERRSDSDAASDNVSADIEDSNVASDSDDAADVAEKKRLRILACCGVGAALLTVGAFYAFFPFEDDAPTAPQVAVALNEKKTSGKNDDVGDVLNEKNPEGRAVEEASASRDPSDAPASFGEIDKLGENSETGEIEATEERGPVERSDVDADASDGDLSNNVDEDATEASDGDLSNDVDEDATDASDGDLSNDVDEDATEASDGDLSNDVDEDATEAVDGDFATPDSVAGEFNEVEFEKANQASSDETADAELSPEEDLGAVASTTELTFQNELPTMKRAVSEIDVEARFALRIRSIEFPSSPVAAVRLLSEFSGVPVAFDWDAFELLRPSTTATLELTAQDVSVGEALEKVASLTNWDVVREQNRVVLKPKGYDPDALIEERFDVSDLTAGASAPSDSAPSSESTIPDRPSVETLETLIRSLIAPNSWAENC